MQGDILFYEPPYIRMCVSCALVIIDYLTKMVGYYGDFIMFICITLVHFSIFSLTSDERYLFLEERRKKYLTINWWSPLIVIRKYASADFRLALGKLH